MRVRTRRAVLTSAIVTVVVAIGAITGFSLPAPGGSVKAAGTPTQTPTKTPIVQEAQVKGFPMYMGEYDILIVPIYSADGGSPIQLHNEVVEQAQSATQQATEWWNGISQGALNLTTVTTHDPIALPSGTSWCTVDSHSKVKQALLNEIKPSTILMILLNKQECAFGGIAMMDNGIIIDASQDYVYSAVVAHELGHVFGLGHSNSMSSIESFLSTCSEGSVPGLNMACTYDEYGDTQSIMGSALVNYVLPPIGQLYEAAFPTNARVLTSTGVQELELDSRSSFGGSRAQSIGIPFMQDQIEGKIWIENRQEGELDELIDVVPGIRLIFVPDRLHTETVASFVISQTGSAETASDKPLETGQSWSSPDSSIKIEVLSDGPVAKVRVTTTPKTPELYAAFDDGDRVKSVDDYGVGTAYSTDFHPTYFSSLLGVCDLTVPVFGSPEPTVTWEQSNDGGNTWTHAGEGRQYMCQVMAPWPSFTLYRAVVKNEVGGFTTPTVRAFSVKAPIHMQQPKSATNQSVDIYLEPGSIDGPATGIRWIKNGKAVLETVLPAESLTSRLYGISADLVNDGFAYALVYYGSHAVMSKLSGS